MSDPGPEEDLRAPSRLKSRIYSALMQRQALEGPLLSLADTRADGRPLCVFEDLVRISPVGEQLQRKNYCRVCHGRLMGENIEGAPVFWSACPYAEFQNR